MAQEDSTTKGTDKTSTLLVEDLLAKPSIVARSLLLERARKHYYDGVLSPVACPRMRLVEDLEWAGFLDLADVARGGGYD